jgi:hypothetical protein
LISRLSRDVIEESCVLFVGAGSTTEKMPHRPSFYSKIKGMACIGDECESLSFPDVMQMFCDERDGGHHNLLVREAINYLEPILLPGPTNHSASQFCAAVASIPFFKTLVTTNWDPLLERALDVLVPITEDRDLAFWDDRKKQVLKLHGCITRPHSIVATRKDYETCVTANALLFNKLRDLMATKTFLFTGYSLQDGDFREVWDSITSRLGRFSKLAYALDPHASDQDVEYWKERGILIFRLFDVQFIRELRKHIVELGLIPSEALVNFLMRERRRIVQIHLRNPQDSDGALSSAMYQDGLLHELDDILDAIQLGTMKHKDLENELGFTVNTLNKAQKQRDVIEIAYWTGRYFAVQAYFEEEQSQIPAYFHPYRLKPLNKLVKGSTWNLSRRKVTKPGTEPPHAHGDDAFFAVCKDCARKLHARQKDTPNRR